MNKLSLWVLGIAFVLIGCNDASPKAVVVPQPQPTLNSLLVTRPEEKKQALNGTEPITIVAIPTRAIFSNDTQVMLLPTATSRPPTSSTSQLNLVTLSFGSDQAPSEPFEEILIYDDSLDANWTLENSTGVEFDLFSTSRWYDDLDESSGLTSGALSIALKPKVDYGSLFFTVRPETLTGYSRDDILGVSFWLYTGTDIVDTGDFAVTVVGSNEQKFWTENDESVFFDGEESFSETRLYFLDINRAIPADSWVKIEVWLDELLYDPDYEYITGVYIKNDAGFQNTVYIDRLALLSLSGS